MAGLKGSVEIDAPDAYCATIDVERKFPNFKVGRASKIESLESEEEKQTKVNQMAEEHKKRFLDAALNLGMDMLLAENIANQKEASFREGYKEAMKEKRKQRRRI